MSDETPPAKKAARKTVRKKSATKRAPRKAAKSESKESLEELPLGSTEDSNHTDSAGQETGTSEEGSASRREPKSGVRDARRETADEPIPDEITEKLVPDGAADQPEKEKPEKANKRGRKQARDAGDDSRNDQRSDQNKPDQNERRGRGRGRGNRERGDRNERREPKQRVAIDSDDLAKKAWKIFESEVTEEGLALLDDNGLRDYARSSFNAARLFLEEKGRIDNREKQSKAEQKRWESDQKEKEKEKDESED